VGDVARELGLAVEKVGGAGSTAPVPVARRRATAVKGIARIFFRSFRGSCSTRLRGPFHAWWTCSRAVLDCRPEAGGLKVCLGDSLNFF
jgi:hypothetical protein